jgi:hypothetical protein
VFFGLLVVLLSGSAFLGAYVLGQDPVKRALAMLAGILPILAVLRLLFGPTVDEKRLSLGGLLKIVPLGAFTFAVFVLLDQTSGLDVLATWPKWRGLAASVVLTVTAAIALALAEWRRRDLWYAEIRGLLIQTLIASVSARLANARSSADLDAVPNEIMKQAAALLAVNLWDTTIVRLAKYIPGAAGRATRAISFWYLEPDPGDAARFRIRWVAAPQATDQVWQLYERIQERHKPRALVPARYEEALNAETFVNDTKRSEYISLAGFVYAYRRVMWNNGGTCKALDRGYEELIKDRRRELSEVDQVWLDFANVYACPVIDQTTEAPRGALIAFKNSPYEIVPNDMVCINIVAHVLELFFAAAEPALPQQLEQSAQ